jgi:hypothetical protein
VAMDPAMASPGRFAREVTARRPDGWKAAITGPACQPQAAFAAQTPSLGARVRQFSASSGIITRG